MMIKPVLKHRFTLGEGPLWACGRLYWFDIAAGKLFAWRPGDAETESWAFGEPVSAAASLENGGLIIASASALLRFDPGTGAAERLVPLEADDSRTRSNDGRADRQGGFWITTMSKAGESGLGTIWRYHRGELRRLLTGLAIPNAVSFSPDGALAYFADTAALTLWRWPLDAEGWPQGDPRPFLKMTEEDGGPDGAVVDREGCIWNARWGAGKVVRLAPGDGRTLETITLPATRPSCPAFGGEDLATLYVTTAQEGMSKEELSAEPDAGAIFAAPLRVPGQPDVPVRLP